MFEEIINEAQAQVSNMLQQKQGMEIGEADKTAETIGKNFINIVQQQVEKKDFSTMKEALSGNVTPPDHPEVLKMVPLLSKELADNGIEKANEISAFVMPELFNMFNDKVALAKQQGIDIPSMMEKFTSGGFGFGSMGTLMSMAGSFMKGGKSGMMNDLLSKFSKK